MKINLILLGAGSSKRFNGNKLLTKIKDKPMYMHIVEKILDLNLNKIIFVTQYEEIKKQLVDYNIHVVMNENSELGISYSIKLGIEADSKCDGYMFIVCDQPFIRTETIRALIDRFIKSGKGMACVEYNNQLGNPTIFSKKYKAELIHLKGDIGGKFVMKQHLDDLEKVKVYDEFELMDIDTKDELEDIVKKYI